MTLSPTELHWRLERTTFTDDVSESAYIWLANWAARDYGEPLPEEDSKPDPMEN